MRTLGLALCLSFGVVAIAAAQDGEFTNPSPVDFSKPFLYDGVRVRPATLMEDKALPVEVIGREELIRRGNPSMEQLIRERTKPAVPKAPVNCLIDPREPISEGHAISCKGTLTVRPATGPVE